MGRAVLKVLIGNIYVGDYVRDIIFFVCRILSGFTFIIRRNVDRSNYRSVARHVPLIGSGMIEKNDLGGRMSRHRERLGVGCEGALPRCCFDNAHCVLLPSSPPFAYVLWASS